MSNNEAFSTKTKYIRIIFGVLIIAWMMVIFGFSAQNADDSSSTSTAITEKVVKIVVKDYNTMSNQEQETVFNKVQFFVRKTAHFSEYAILGILIWLFLRTYNILIKYKIGISWFISTIYAATDEFHQTFSSGRSPQIRDVCIDSIGAMTGVLAVTILFMIIGHIKTKRIR